LFLCAAQQSVGHFTCLKIQDRLETLADSRNRGKRGSASL